MLNMDGLVRCYITAVLLSSLLGASGIYASVNEDIQIEEQDTWRMTPVTSIQARVQGDAPAWDEEHQVYVSNFGKTFEQKYTSVLDTVNTASVEGALMYVQAEGINVAEQSVKCERKNKMKYVVFYQVTLVQTSNAIAHYTSKGAPTLEYCPFVAMDSGKCTPTGENELPAECKQYNGLDDQPPLGACVGAESKNTDFRAPYPDNYWFSYPNSCPGSTWQEKTSKCREEQPGGLCPFGTQPDGIACTYAYQILGYVSIDDVVGITKLKSSSTGKTYGNYTQFCEDGGIEFEAKNTGKEFEVETSLPFWSNPSDPEANRERSEQLVQVYNSQVKDQESSNKAMMKPLPSIQELESKNPPCYLNDKKCADAPNGCRRNLYAQICQICDKPSTECIKKPSEFEYPKLSVDTEFKLDPSEAKEGKPLTFSTAGSGSDTSSSFSTSASSSGTIDLTSLETQASTSTPPTATTPNPTSSSISSLRQENTLRLATVLGLVGILASVY